MHDDDEKNKLEGADDDITNDAQLVSPAQYTSGFFGWWSGGGIGVARAYTVDNIKGIRLDQKIYYG